MRQAQRRDDDRELAHLGEVDRGHDARPQPEAQGVEDGHHDDAADDHEDRGRQRQLEHLQARDRDLHAERDEEEGDEEVADADRLGDHVDVVGKCRQAHARDQGSHLAGEPDQARRARQEEAPAKRGDKHELRRLGHHAEQVRQHVLGEARSRATTSTAPRHREPRSGTRFGLRMFGCTASIADRPQVLDDQHAERDPAGERVELELVVQDLDDDQRAGQAHAGGQVQKRAVARARCARRRRRRTPARARCRSEPAARR